MKLFITITISMVFLFSFSFILFESLGYTDEKLFASFFEMLIISTAGTWIVGFSAIALLVLDLFLPVPSSIVMTLSGHFLGFATAVVVNITGGLGASLLGFYLTRRFGAQGFRKVVGSHDTARIETFFNTYGIWAILLSRGVPMLTEVISCLAGLSEMSYRRFLISSIAGVIPVSIVYAWAGSYSHDGGGFEVPLIVAFIIPGIGFALLKLYNSRYQKVASNEK